MDFITVLENPYLASLGITPALSTRPATALLVMIGGLQLYDLSTPGWLLSWYTILILFAVAYIEWNAGKNSALNELIEPLMPFFKVAVAFMVAIVLTDPQTSEIANSVLAQEIIDTPWWHSIGSLIWAIGMGVLAWFASIYRSTFYFFLTEFDEDNDLGLLSLYSWMEFLFTGTSALLALVIPVVAIAMFLAVGLTLRWLRHYLSQVEEKKRIPCSGDCGTTIYPSAISCPNCRTPNPTPMKVGLLGQTTTNYVTDMKKHPWDLMAQKRCPRCATRYHGRDMHIVCECCQTSVLDSPKAVQAYVGNFDQRLPQVLIVCALVGLVPFIGLIVGVAYFRLNIVAPMRRYVPAVQGCFGRSFIRAINLVLSAFQPIPFLGAAILPVMCLINYRLYRNMLVRSQYRPIEQPIKPAAKGLT